MEMKKPSTIGEIKERCLSKPKDDISVPFDEIDSVVKDLVDVYFKKNKLIEVGFIISNLCNILMLGVFVVFMFVLLILRLSVPVWGI